MIFQKLTKLRHFFILFVLFAVLLVIRVEITQASPPKAGPGDALFRDSNTQGDIDRSNDPSIIRTRFVDVNFNLLGDPDRTDSGGRISGIEDVIQLNLFDDVNFTATLDRIEPKDSGSYAWIGDLDGIPLGRVVLVVNDGIMAGNVSLPGGFYQVRYAGNNTHAIYQIDQTAFPGDEPIPIVLPEEPVSPDVAADDGSIIDIMVVYTADARLAAGGITAMTTLIDLAVTETNDSYANSGINPRLNLVHTEEVVYTESGDIFTDLTRLQNTADGYMDSVHTLRDTYGADGVTLIVDNGGLYCGVANIMMTVSASFESFAFNVVARTCATGYYSFGHELGHTMGARHDWYVDSTDNSPFTYNHGYVNVGDQWRTVMAYNSECSASGVNCTRLQYWSNPDITYGGDPMGVPEGSFHAADNRKTLNNTALTYANFRQSTTPSGGGPLVYNSHTVDDDNTSNSSGNNDGIVDCGENIELYVDLLNQGSNTTTGINATISTSDSYVTWLYNISSAYPDIVASGTGTNTNDFDFAVDPNTPNGHLIQFDLDITASNGGPWADSFTVPVTCPTPIDVYEPDNNSTEATPIDDGVLQANHTIAPVGDEDWVTFTLTQESAVLLETSGPSVPPPGLSQDTRMWLYDSNLTQIEYNDDGGTGYYSRIDRLCDVDALPAGTYFVQIDEYLDNHEISTYDISYTVTETCGGTDLVLWDTSHGVLLDYTPSGRYSDLKAELESMGYTIDQNDSGVLNLDLSQYAAIVVNVASAWDTPYTAAEATAIQTYVDNGGGLVVMGDNSIGGVPNDNVNPIAQLFGTTVGIGSIDNSISNLVVHPVFDGVSEVTFLVGGSMSVAYPAQGVGFDSSYQLGVAVASVGTGRVVTIGDVNVWDNGNVQFDGEDPTVGNVQFDAGESIASGLDIAGNGTFARNVFDWITNVVGDSYEPDDTWTSASPIDDGFSQIHSLVPVGDEDWVTFTLAQESAVLLETSGPNGDTRMWLYDSGLNQIEYNDDGGTGLFSKIDRLCGIDALSAGTYFVQIDEYGDDHEIPSYELSYTVTETCGQSGGGLVLWDTSHGIYFDYAPSGRYSDLKAELESIGYTIDQNDSGVLNLDLSQYAAIVVNVASAWDTPYTSAEATAIESYVNNGGGLVVMGDNSIYGVPNDNVNPIAQLFGTTVGVGPINDSISNLTVHPVFDGVSEVTFLVGGSMSAVSPAQGVGFDSSSQLGVAVASVGTGRVVTIGDVDVWDNGNVQFDSEALTVGNVQFDTGESIDSGLDIAGNGTFARNVFDWITTSSVPNLAYDAYLIDDDNSGNSSGNNDGIANCGEIIELYVDLLNSGTAIATGVNATISTSDPYVTWLYNISSDYPDIPVSGTGTNYYDFDFDLDANAPDGHQIQFDLDIIAASGGPWTDSFTVPVNCPAEVDIDVTPLSLTVSLSQGQMTTEPMDISNVGGGILSYAIAEVDTTTDLPATPDALKENVAPSWTGLIEDVSEYDGYFFNGAWYKGQAPNELTPAPDVQHIMSTANVVIDFDDLAQPCVFIQTVALREAYAAFGVHFTGPATNDGGGILDECGGFAVSGHSPPNFLAFNTALTFSDSGVPRPPQTVTFDMPLTYIEAKVGSNSGSGTLLTMTAYDMNNNMVGTTSTTLSSALQTISISATDIHRVVFDTTAAVFVLDDLGWNSSTSDVPWLSENPTSGLVTAGSTDNVAVTFDATSLAVGTYTADLVISNNDPDENPVTVPVVLNVTPATNPPNIPSNPTPADGLTNVSILTDLSWTGGDPDPGDTVIYDVYLEAGNPTPSTLICGDVPSPTCDPGTLAPDTLYYWQVIAEDNHGAVTAGPVWSFTTGSANTIPNLTIPSNIPGYQGVIVSVPVNFSANGSQIASTIFSIDFDETCLDFDPTDSDLDDIPDAVTLSLPANFLATVSYDAADTDGELDFTIFSIPLTLLPDSTLATIDFTVTCSPGAVTPVNFSTAPQASFGDITGQSVPGTTTNGSVEIQQGTRGDCNSDQVVDAGDISAVVLEIFDGDGNIPAQAPGGTFPGNPIGCNSNEDLVIDAGDVICTALIVFNGPGACSAIDLKPDDELNIPMLTIPDQVPAVPGEAVTIPITFAANNNNIAAVSFSVDYDQNSLSLDPTDGNGDNIPDAVTLNVPTAFGLTSVQVDPNDTDGELDIIIADIAPPLASLPDGVIASITLQVHDSIDSQEATVNFSLDPPASFSDTNGRSVQHVTNNGSVLISAGTKIFLPIITKE